MIGPLQIQTNEAIDLSFLLMNMDAAKQKFHMDTWTRTRPEFVLNPVGSKIINEIALG